MSQDKPVAAQEPFGYWHQGETDEESDFFPVSYCHGAGSDCLDCIPLYDHAAPCARCADAEQLHYKEMAERTVQEEFLLAAHADLEAKITEQAERIKALDTANTNVFAALVTEQKMRLTAEDKLAKADAVIEVCHYAIRGSSPKDAAYETALYDIEQYQKGEEA